MIVEAVASRTSSAPCPARAAPFLVLGGWLCLAIQGRCSSMVNRVVRSTMVPIAELSARG